MNWGSVPDWVVAVTAIAGSAFAAFQLRSLAISEKSASASQALAAIAQQTASASYHDQVQVARAQLLLMIDSEFEGPELYRSRKAVRALRNRSESAVQNHGLRDQSPEGRRAAVAEEFSHQLDLLWKDARAFNEVDVDNPKAADRIAADRYTELLALPNWIETIGMLCKRNLLPKDDILDLYDSVIIPTMRNFEKHVQARRAEGPYLNPRFMENAYWILQEADRFKSEREAPKQLPPAASRTDWNA